MDTDRSEASSPTPPNANPVDRQDHAANPACSPGGDISSGTDESVIGAIKQHLTSENEQTRLEAAELDIDTKTLEINREALEISRRTLHIDTRRHGIEIFILLAAVLTMVATCYQWKEMHETLVEMQRQTPGILDAGKAAKDSVEEARKSRAEAATEADRSARETRRANEASLALSKAALDASIAASRLDQRAWVVIKAVDLSPLEKGRPVKATVTFGNVGKTIAKSEYMHMVIGVDDGKRNFSEMPLDRTKRAVPKELVVIFPGGAPVKWAEISIPPGKAEEVLKMIENGKAFIHIAGEIRYADIFNQSHLTTFLYTYEPATKSFVVVHADAN